MMDVIGETDVSQRVFNCFCKQIPVCLFKVRISRATDCSGCGFFVDADMDGEMVGGQVGVGGP